MALETLLMLPLNLSTGLHMRFVSHINTPPASSLRVLQHGMDDLKAMALGEIARPINQMEQSWLLEAAFTPFASR